MDLFSFAEEQAAQRKPAENRVLTVFPSELAKRRYLQEQALKEGWADAATILTQQQLRRDLFLFARKAGLIDGKIVTEAQRLVLLRETVQSVRPQFHAKGPLASVSDNALKDILKQSVRELAGFGLEVEPILEWMHDRAPTQKLYQLAQLYRGWRRAVSELGAVDQNALNAAVYELLQQPEARWPVYLRNPAGLEFRSVPWLNPFEERVVEALKRRFGKKRVKVYSALPAAHAEKAEERFGCRIRSEIMVPPEQSWAGWMEDLGDALEMDSAGIFQDEELGRIAFSRSGGEYGEIEDAARRICWELTEMKTPANRIALVVPNIGAVQDVIAHVFGRFGIPYYLRRGRPVLSAPAVKAFLALISFSRRRDRGELIDLIRNPAIRWEGMDSVEVREAAVVRLMESGMLPRVDAAALERQLPAVAAQLRELTNLSGEKAAELLQAWIAVDEEDTLNREAVESVSRALSELGNRPLKAEELVDLAEELLGEATVKAFGSEEQGVWIINPYDAAGLLFDVVLFAGLNDGKFPAIPQQDALLNDAERFYLREHLEARGLHLPKLALSPAEVQLEQQSILFMTVLGMVRERLVLSCQSADQDGGEKTPGEYYRKLWSLTGWAASELIELSPYDQWRIAQLDDASVFVRHYAAQQTLAPMDREPMPGESFMPVVPFALCRAEDELLQAAAQEGRALPQPEGADEAASGGLSQLTAVMQMEAGREAWVEEPAEMREPNVYCGNMPEMQAKIAAWFDAKKAFAPTALEALAQGRYPFLLERMLMIRPAREADDAPDPMDRGSLVHAIMHTFYAALSGDMEPVEKAGVAVGERWVKLCRPRHWAVRELDGWRRVERPGADTIALVSFLPDAEALYLELLEAVAKACFARAERKGGRLGHPGVWAAEKKKLLMILHNFLLCDLKVCVENGTHPALFELGFDDLILTEGDERICLRGRIDRVDLQFDVDNRLCGIRVLDYKGSGRARSKTEEYVEEIRLNLDCQLPVYAFAVQQRLFGVFNREDLNEMTEAGYHFQQRDLSVLLRGFRKGLVSMAALTEAGEPLTEAFLKTLFTNLRRLKAGDFSVDPMVAGFTDYQSICRTTPVDAADLEE